MTTAKANGRSGAGPSAGSDVPGVSERARARGKGSRRGARGRSLSREEIVAAALDLAETSGESALSMRRIGDQLGVDATAFYRHFRDKDELLVAMFDQILAMQIGPVTALTQDAGWRARLELMAEVCWESQRRYPVTFGITFARVTGGEAELTLVKFILGALSQTGLPPRDIVRAYRTFVESMLGMCGMQANVDSLDPEYRARDVAGWSRIYAAVPEAGFPGARRLGAELAQVSDEETYSLMVGAVLDWVEGTIAAHRSTATLA